MHRCVLANSLCVLYLCLLGGGSLVSSNNSQPRFLVVLIGSIQGGEKAWDSLYRNVLKYNDADLGLLVEKSQDRSSSLFSIAKYEWFCNEFDNWSEALDSIGGDGSWREIAMRNSKETDGHVLGGTREDPHGNKAVLAYQKWALIQHLTEERLLEKYDYFVVSQTNLYYGCPLDLSALVPRGDYVWIPDGHDQRGLNDHFIMCSRAHITDCLDTIEPLITNTWRYHDFVGNAEMLLKLRLQETGLLSMVQRFERNMFTVYDDWQGQSLNAGSDGIYRMMSKQGVRVNCVEEYDMTTATCGNTMDPGDDSLAADRTLLIMYDWVWDHRAFTMSYERFLLNQRSNLDLAVVIPPNADDVQRNSLYKSAKYIWEVPEFDSWDTALDEIGGNGMWRLVARNSAFHGHLLEGTSYDWTADTDRRGGSSSSVSILYQKHLIYDKIVELNLRDIYFQFVVFPGNTFFPCTFSMANFDVSHIWTPKDRRQEGQKTDNVIVTSHFFILEVLDMLAPLVLRAEDYMDFQGGREDFFRLRMKETSRTKKMKRFSHKNFQVSGIVDVHAKRKPKGNAYLVLGNYRIYGSEPDNFRFAMEECGIRKRPNKKGQQRRILGTEEFDLQAEGPDANEGINITVT